MTTLNSRRLTEQPKHLEALEESDETGTGNAWR